MHIFCGNVLTCGSERYIIIVGLFCNLTLLPNLLLTLEKHSEDQEVIEKHTYDHEIHRIAKKKENKSNTLSDKVFNAIIYLRLVVIGAIKLLLIHKVIVEDIFRPLSQHKV